jgi:hypothetical protein
MTEDDKKEILSSDEKGAAKSTLGGYPKHCHRSLVMAASFGSAALGPGRLDPGSLVQLQPAAPRI